VASQFWVSTWFQACRGKHAHTDIRILEVDWWLHWLFHAFTKKKAIKSWDYSTSWMMLKRSLIAKGMIPGDFWSPCHFIPQVSKRFMECLSIHVIQLLPSVTQREEMLTPTTGEGGEWGFSVRLLGSNNRVYLEILSTTKNHSLGMWWKNKERAEGKC